LPASDLNFRDSSIRILQERDCVRKEIVGFFSIVRNRNRSALQRDDLQAGRPDSECEAIERRVEHQLFFVRPSYHAGTGSLFRYQDSTALVVRQDDAFCRHCRTVNIPSDLAVVRLDPHFTTRMLPPLPWPLDVAPDRNACDLRSPVKCPQFSNLIVRNAATQGHLMALQRRKRHSFLSQRDKIDPRPLNPVVSPALKFTAACGPEKLMDHGAQFGQRRGWKKWRIAGCRPDLTEQTTPHRRISRWRHAANRFQNQVS
jgi:hypothetical protein